MCLFVYCLILLMVFLVVYVFEVIVGQVWGGCVYFVSDVECVLLFILISVSVLVVVKFSVSGIGSIGGGGDDDVLLCLCVLKWYSFLLGMFC